MDVLWNNQVIYEYRPYSRNISRIKLDVKATGGINTLTFRGKSNTGNSGANIDNVDLRRPYSCSTYHDCADLKDWACIKNICFEKCKTFTGKVHDPFDRKCISRPAADSVVFAVEYANKNFRKCELPELTKEAKSELKK